MISPILVGNVKTTTEEISWRQIYSYDEANNQKHGTTHESRTQPTVIEKHAMAEQHARISES